jgi:hypothetical protein
MALDDALASGFHHNVGTCQGGNKTLQAARLRRDGRRMRSIRPDAAYLDSAAGL